MPAAPAVTRSEKIAIKKHRTGLQNGCRQAAAAGEREGNKNAPRGSWRGRKRGHIMKKRILSILLALCMVLMLCPVTAFAEDNYSTLTWNFQYGTLIDNGVEQKASP